MFPEVGGMRKSRIARESQVMTYLHPGYCNKSAVLGLIAVLGCGGWVGSDAGFDSWVG